MTKIELELGDMAVCGHCGMIGLVHQITTRMTKNGPIPSLSLMYAQSLISPGHLNCRLATWEEISAAGLSGIGRNRP